MRHFLKDTNGSATIWAAFLILILCTLSFVVYASVTVYAKYQTCETELERAAIVTVDKSMVNANVRDVALNIPAVPAETLLEDNLAQTGWTREDGDWVKRNGEKLIYSLEDMKITIEEQSLRIDAVLVMPLPWLIGNQTQAKIPIIVRSTVIYLD